jgi:hypothetical protein
MRRASLEGRSVPDQQARPDNCDAPQEEQRTPVANETEGEAGMIEGSDPRSTSGRQARPLLEPGQHECLARLVEDQDQNGN